MTEVFRVTARARQVTVTVVGCGHTELVAVQRTEAESRYEVVAVVEDAAAERATLPESSNRARTRGWAGLVTVTRVSVALMVVLVSCSSVLRVAGRWPVRRRQPLVDRWVRRSARTTARPG